MTGLLLVTGGDEYARSLYATESRAYWTAALPLVLEKHGFTDFDVVDADAALSRPWEDYAGVLVGELPAVRWTEDFVERLRTSPVLALAEGPLPTSVTEALGIGDEGDVEGTARIVVTDEVLNAESRRYGRAPGGFVGQPAVRQSSGTEWRLRWSSNPALGISRRRAEIWAAQSWGFRRWADASGETVLAVWSAEETPGEARPALVRSGNVIASCFGLFSYLGRAQTSIPLAPDRTATFHRTMGLETMLLALVDLMYRESGRPRARVAPWPSGVEWVRNVRHDFDRPVTLDYLRHVLSEHARVGSAATWYWRAEPRWRAARVGSDPVLLGQAAVVAEQPRHEVGIHTELMHAGAGGEREVVEYALGRRVEGSSAHGAANCFRYQGAPNVLWAERQGLAYTELLEQNHYHPHRFACLDEQGRIRFLRVLCLPHHVSFDVSDGETYEESARKAVPDWVAARGLLQVMNHPDINLDALMAFLESTPAEGRADWTAAEAAAWWRSTHVADELRLWTSGDGTIHVRATTDVQGLVIEVLQASGSSSAVSVDLRAGTATELSAELLSPSGAVH